MKRSVRHALLSVLLVVVVFSIFSFEAEAYARANTMCPELTPLDEQTTAWVFYSGGNRYIETDFTNVGLELLYASIVCSRGLQCQFTPPFSRDTGCYCCSSWDRSWYNIFVNENDKDVFEKAWEPIHALRYWKYQYALPLAERLGLHKLFRENNVYEVSTKCLGEEGISPRPTPSPLTNTSRPDA